MNGSDSSANAATVVVVERDYSRGLTPQFDTKVPRELQDRIAQDEFARIVEYVNACITDSDSVTCGSACENITAYLTCFLSLLFCKTHSQRVCSRSSPPSPSTHAYTPSLPHSRHAQCFERLDKFLAEQNGFYDDYGLEFVSPLANGLLHFDVIVRPFSSKWLSSTDGTTGMGAPHVSETDALMPDSAPASTTSSPAGSSAV